MPQQIRTRFRRTFPFSIAIHVGGYLKYLTAQITSILSHFKARIQSPKNDFISDEVDGN